MSRRRKQHEEQQSTFYTRKYDWYDDGNDDDVPEGCAACGGPYPSCCDACPLFDD